MEPNEYQAALEEMPDWKLDDPDILTSWLANHEPVIKKALTQAAVPREVPGWKPIETAPKKEITSFLVKSKSDMYDYVVIQVSRFQGDLYPDFLGSNVDWQDRITDATHWQPLPAAPSQKAPEPLPLQRDGLLDRAMQYHAAKNDPDNPLHDEHEPGADMMIGKIRIDLTRTKNLKTGE